MSNWSDVMAARRESDTMASESRNDSGLTHDEALISAVCALRLELRALGVLIDFARGDAR